MDHGARPDNPRALQFSVRVHVSLVLQVCPGLPSPSPSPTDSINIESLGAYSGVADPRTSQHTSPSSLSGGSPDSTRPGKNASCVCVRVRVCVRMCVCVCVCVCVYFMHFFCR